MTPPLAVSLTARNLVEVREEKRIRWHVDEVSCGDHPGALRPRCLVFTSDLKMRRIYDYPADWRSMDDDALLALSWGR
jgi:hypothetical protein